MCYTICLASITPAGCVAAHALGARGIRGPPALGLQCSPPLSRLPMGCLRPATMGHNTLYVSTASMLGGMPKRGRAVAASHKVCAVSRKNKTYLIEAHCAGHHTAIRRAGTHLCHRRVVRLGRDGWPNADHRGKHGLQQPPGNQPAPPCFDISGRSVLLPQCYLLPATARSHTLW